MFKRLPNFGSIGVITDTVGEALSIGAWSDALNIRFTGVEMQKMLEPEKFIDTSTDGSVWMQTWADGLTTYLAVASGDSIFIYHDDGFNQSWSNASREEGYNTDGYWSSTAWGDTCIFNNGIDAPQIYNPMTSKFEDLPKWGLKSTAEDILNNDEPSEKVQASCVRIVPFKSFLVAVGVTESGLYQPNKVWWSDTTNLAGYDGAPNWDYETPASLSGQIVIDPEGGAIRTAVVLNEQLIIYTDAGATAMMNVGGSLVMQFRRLFNKGAAGLHCVAEVNNSHFCISQDQIYQHDGSTVQLLAKDRIEEEFFKVIGKGGRHGLGDVDWAGLQVVKNPDRKEVTVNYGVPATSSGGGGTTCKYYSCSSLNDELTSQGVTHSIIGLGSTVDWDYPLAQTSPGTHGTPDMFSAWTEKVNAPTLIADWAAFYPADNEMTGWGWYDEASKYGLCSGLAIRAMILQGNDRIQDITPPTDLYVAAESSSAVAVVTGYAGGTQAGGIGIDFQNGGAAVYQVVTRVYGSDKYNDRMASLRTALSSDVNGVPTVSIYVGDGAGDSSGSVKSSAVDGQQWFNISLTESSWFEVITIDPYHYRVHKTATVTITSQDGFVDTTSVSGYIESYTAEGTGYYKSHTLVDPTPFNQTPGFFLGDTNRKVTLAYLAYGLVETDHTKISETFLQNFTDYVDPDPNCIPVEPQ